jgi:hypothetical protein
LLSSCIGSRTVEACGQSDNNLWRRGDFQVAVWRLRSIYILDERHTCFHPVKQSRVTGWWHGHLVTGGLAADAGAASKVVGWRGAGQPELDIIWSCGGKLEAVVAACWAFEHWQTAHGRAGLRLIVDMVVGANTEHSIGSRWMSALAFVSWQHREGQGGRCERRKGVCKQWQWWVNSLELCV